MWRIGVQVKAEQVALRVSEKQTFLGHLMLQRWVIGPLDIQDIKYEMPRVYSVLCLGTSQFYQFLQAFMLHIFSHASGVALGMPMAAGWSTTGPD